MEVPHALMTHVLISIQLLYIKFCIMLHDVMQFVLPSGFATQFIRHSLRNSELINFRESVNSTGKLRRLCVEERRSCLAGRANVPGRINSTCLFA
jgi:hypothetical protein